MNKLVESDRQLDNDGIQYKLCEDKTAAITVRTKHAYLRVYITSLDDPVHTIEIDDASGDGCLYLKNLLRDFPYWKQ